MTFLFNTPKTIIGVIHVGALPGTPRGSKSVVELVRQAKEEARVYRECGVDGVIIENMHDVPYLKGEVGPEMTASSSVRRSKSTACGRTLSIPPAARGSSANYLNNLPAYSRNTV